VVANWVEKLHAHRITLTAPVLNNAALVVFLVSGREKAEVLKEILEGDYRPDLLPAQIIRPENGRLLWLVDQAAAGCLSDSIRT
jgi:6-phosphogluconolactonase